MEQKRKTLARLAILVLSVCLALLIVEVTLRVAWPHIDIYQRTGRVGGPSPMSEWAHADAFSAYTPRPGLEFEGKTVNSMGFMSTPEIELTKPEDTIRIVFLGGSSTAGTGRNLPDHETWPWQVAQLVADQTGKRIDFINAAASGYTSFESYGRLWSRLRFFEPDIVVVNHGWNEMYYFNSDEMRTFRTLPDGSWSLTEPRMNATHAPHWVDPFIRYSQTLTRLRLALTTDAGGEVGEPGAARLASDFKRDNLEVWRTNLRLMKEACELMGADLFVVKQATLIVPGLSEEDQARCEYGYHGFDHDAHVEAYREIYRVIEEEFPKESVIDLTSVSGRPECFFDHVHPTARGANEFAQIVASALVRHLNR